MFYPKMYKKSVFEIPYERLKKQKVKVLLFDLDNTIASLDEEEANSDIKKLFKKLSKDFKIFIVSNNSSKKRVEVFANSLNINYFYFSMKPSTRIINKIIKRYNVCFWQIAMIGDQLITDILSANRGGCVSILVEPLAKKDLKITGLNRFFEDKIIKYYNKKGIFKRGEYYG